MSALVAVCKGAGRRPGGESSPSVTTRARAGGDDSPFTAKRPDARPPTAGRDCASRSDYELIANCRRTLQSVAAKFADDIRCVSGTRGVPRSEVALMPHFSGVVVVVNHDGAFLERLDSGIGLRPIGAVDLLSSLALAYIIELA